MKLIINADDMGFSKGVVDGIISAHKNGVVSSCTIMPTMPAFDYAITKLLDTKTLGCGVHLTLSAYSPLLDGHKTLLDKNGVFFRRVTDEVSSKFDKDEVYNEWVSQIEKVKATNIEITHLDSHHHVHINESLKEVMQKIVDKYKLPVRGGMKYSLKNTNVVPLIMDFYKENVSVKYFMENIEKIKSYDVADIMTHPAFVDDFLKENTSYSDYRKIEYDVLTDKALKKLFEKEGIELVSYKNL